MQTGELPANVKCDATGEPCPMRVAIREDLLERGKNPDWGVSRHRGLERRMGHFGCFGAASDGECGVNFVLREADERAQLEAEAAQPPEGWRRLQVLAAQYGGYDWSAPVQKKRTLLR